MIFTPFQFSKSDSDVFQNTGFLSGFTSQIKNTQQAFQLLDFQTADELVSKFNRETLNGTQNLDQFMKACTDPSFKNYIKTYEGGQATIQGYTAATKESNIALNATGTASKVAAIGMKALSVASNVGIWLLVSEGISWVVRQLENLANAQQNAIDAADKLSLSYTSNVQNANNNISTLQGLQAKYDELSKGVDKYGNNVALSTDEYKEYKDIVSQVIGISPSLQTGYDKEGNAIANNNGLIQKSIELEQEKIRIEKENQITDSNLWTIAQGAIGNYNNQLSSVNQKMEQVGTDIANNLSTTLQNSQDKYKEFLSIFNLNDSGLDKQSLYNQQGYITQLLRNSDNLKKVVDTLKSNPLLLKEFINTDGINKVQSDLSEYVQTLSELETKSKSFNSTLQIVPEALTSYNTLDNASKNFLTEYINGFNVTANTTQDDVKKMKQAIKSLTDDLANSTGAKTLIDQLFSIDSSKISATDYEQQIDKIISQISNYLKLDKNRLKVDLGFDTTPTEINTMLSELENKVKPETYKYIKGLSLEDLKIAYKIENVGNISPSELASEISKIKSSALNAASATDTLADAIDKIKEASSVFEAAKKDITDYKTISIDTLQSIVKQYPELENAVSQYQAGIISTSTMMADLQNVYNQDVNNYKESLLVKLKDNDSFYSQTILKNSKFVSTFKELYGIDLTNYKNLAQAKADVDNKLLKDLIDNWSKFYNAQADTFTDDFAKLGMAAGTSKDALANVSKIEDEVNRYRKAKADLDKISLTGISFSTESGLKSGAADAKQNEKASTENTALKNAEALLDYQKQMGQYTSDNLYKQIQLDQQYVAATEVLKKYAKTTDEIHEVNEKIKSAQDELATAQKNYAQDVLDTSKKELENRQNLGVVLDNTAAKLQNLNEIYKNLTTNSMMSPVNTEENRAELEQEIYDTKKGILEAESTELDNEVNLGKIQEGTLEYLQRLQKIRQDINNSDLGVADKTAELESINEKIYSANASYNESQINALDHLVAIGKIQENSLDYVRRLNSLYHSLNLTLEQRQSLQEKIFSAEKSYISQLESDLSDETIEGSYGNRIKAIQDQIDALDKENDAYSKQIQLEKDLAALEEAKNQKTINLYQEGKGFTYVADQSSIVEKQQTVANDQRQAQIDQLNQQKEALQNEEDSIKNQLEASLKELDGTNTKTWDNIQAEISNVIAHVGNIISSYTQNVKSNYAEQDDALDNSTDNINDDYSQQVKSMNWYVEQTNKIQPQILKQNQSLADSFNAVAVAMNNAAKAVVNLEENRENANYRYYTYNQELDKNGEAVKYHASGSRYIKKDEHSIVDENGEEIVIPPITNGRLTYLQKGSSVLPADLTKNIWDMAIDPSNFISKYMSGLNLNPVIKVNTQSGNAQAPNLNQYSFEKLVLPNVTNANDLISELSNLKLDAIQRSTKH